LIDNIHKDKIVDVLSKLQVSITQKDYGYKPETDCVLQPNLSEKEKIEHLWLHSEKMAFAWSLLNIDSFPLDKPIVIHKNLRVCHDCHTTFKLFSDYLKRTIILRDSNRFHHFEDGKCSCNDYW
jgi:DYW family of nucleic acid deaminases